MQRYGGFTTVELPHQQRTLQRSKVVASQRQEADVGGSLDAGGARPAVQQRQLPKVCAGPAASAQTSSRSYWGPPSCASAYMRHPQEGALEVRSTQLDISSAAISTHPRRLPVVRPSAPATLQTPASTIYKLSPFSPCSTKRTAIKTADNAQQPLHAGPWLFCTSLVTAPASLWCLQQHAAVLARPCRVLTAAQAPANQTMAPAQSNRSIAQCWDACQHHVSQVTGNFERRAPEAPTR